MNKKEFIEWLKRFKPCKEALEWSIKTNYKTAEEAWALCDRPDWLTWLADTVTLPEQDSPEHRKMTKCVCECLELIKHLMPDESKDCFEQLKIWADGGDVDLEELKRKACGSYSKVAVTVAAAYASAASAVAEATHAFTASAADAADASPESNLEICNIIRKYYKINDLIERGKS